MKLSPETQALWDTYNEGKFPDQIKEKQLDRQESEIKIERQRKLMEDKRIHEESKGKLFSYRQVSGVSNRGNKLGFKPMIGQTVKYQLWNGPIVDAIVRKSVYESREENAGKGRGVRNYYRVTVEIL